MSAPQSDALVFFGATGDLAYKKILPSLQALVKRGKLDVPVIGVAKADWTRDQLKARAKDSLQRVGCGEYSNRINRERCGSFVTASYGLVGAPLPRVSPSRKMVTHL